VPILKHTAVYIIDEMITRAKRTLAKGDIARICKRNLLSVSPGGSTRREVVPAGRIWDPHFGEGHGHRELPTVPFERAMVVSYRLSIVTIALSLTIRPQFAINKTCETPYIC